MSYTLNKVQLIGNLAADPEIKQMQSGKAIANLTVATSEEWKTDDGEKKSKTEWNKVVVFGGSAENCKKYLQKGDKVYVEGQLQTSSWDDKEGNKKYKTEIVAKNIIYLTVKRTAQSETPQAEATDVEQAVSTSAIEDLPF